MTLLQAFNDFMRFKQSYCVDASVRYYLENVSRFNKWVCAAYDSEPAVLPVDCLTRQNYLDYLVWLRGQDIKNTSLLTYIRSVKVFLRWLYEEGYLDSDITQRVKYPRPDPDFVYPLTIEEGIRLDSCFDLSVYLGLRNYCMVHLMLDCGLRSGEVAALQRGHLHEHFLLVFDSKYNKSRNVPLPDWLGNRLCSLLSICSNSDFVFMDRYQHNPVSENTIKQLFADLKVQSGIERIHAHLLRHTFASSFIYYGGGMELLRVLLGHSSYQVTQNYLHIASQMLISGYDMYKIDDVFFNLTLLNRR